MINIPWRLSTRTHARLNGRFLRRLETVRAKTAPIEDCSPISSGEGPSHRFETEDAVGVDRGTAGGGRVAADRNVTQRF